MNLKLKYNNYDIELSNDETYSLNSSNNSFQYDNVYHDDESVEYRSSKHSVKVFADGQYCKSAIVCAVGGGTGVFADSAVVWDDNIYVCCADKVFSLSLPDLRLNWMLQADKATCFGIYHADNGLFIHGEMRVTRLDSNGTMLWEAGLRDIIVYIDEEQRYQDAFVMHDNYIALIDFNGNKYQLGFDGKFISEQISEQQIRWDTARDNMDKKHEKTWWKFWA